MQLEGLDHVALGVRDIERSAKWYIEVLGFERLHEVMWDGVPTFVGKGNTGLALFPASQNAKPTQGTHRDIRILHLAFRADRENFLARSANYKSAKSNLNSKITKSRTQFIFAIPTVTSWRSQHMNSKGERRKYAFIDALQSDSHWAATRFRK
jgi:glyoxalase/bleomycin resistance protein/dioxygenase superfamily protein